MLLGMAHMDFYFILFILYIFSCIIVEYLSYLKDYLSSTELFSIHVEINVVFFFFLNSNLSIDLFVCFNSTILSWLLQLYHESWNQVVLFIQLCFLFQSCFGDCRSYAMTCEFKNKFLIFTEEIYVACLHIIDSKNVIVLLKYKHIITQISLL